MVKCGRFFMSQPVLLRIFKRMKRNPKKCYILKDFGLPSQSGRVYMNTLIKLNLIELCSAFYKTGAKYSAYHGVKGYRLK